MATHDELGPILQEQLKRYASDRKAAIEDAKRLVERFNKVGFTAAMNRPRELTAMTAMLGHMIVASMNDAHEAGKRGEALPHPPDMVAAILFDACTTLMGIGYADGQARNGLRAFEEALAAKGDDDNG